MSNDLKSIIDNIKFSDPEPQQIYNFYSSSMKYLSSDNFEHDNLRETSNLHHNAVYDYLDKYGADIYFRIHLQGIYQWLKMIAEKNNIDLPK